jgi:tripartite-type tricarboxylate transporter receptor subunit TctC
MKNIVFAAAIGIAVILGAPAPSHAQDFPNRVITILVPYPAGGPTDATARVVAAQMSNRLGHQVVVENVSGAGSTLAMQRVARAQADGYTLLVHNMAFSSAIALFPNVKLDPLKDFAPVGLINSNGNIIVGRKTLPANNLKEFVAWAKSGVAVKFAHPGVGNMGHLCAALFNQAVGATNVDYIPYRGGAPATQDVIAGHADLFCSTTQLVLEPIKTGLVKAFGITAPERLPQLPEVPSLVQEFGPKLDITYWHGLFAPAGTPKPVMDKLNATLGAIVSDPQIVKMWSDQGVLVYPKEQQSPEAATALVTSEMKRWGDVIRENKIEAPLQ